MVKVGVEFFGNAEIAGQNRFPQLIGQTVGSGSQSAMIAETPPALLDIIWRAQFGRKMSNSESMPENRSFENVPRVNMSGYRSTRSSPTRRVMRCWSRYSSRGRTYLRLVPKMVRASATVTLPLALRCSTMRPAMSS